MRKVILSADRLALDRIEHGEITRSLLDYKPVVVWNETVFALVVNARDPNVLKEVHDLKSTGDKTHERGTQQPVAWISSFRSFTETIDKDEIKEPTLRDFVHNPDKMTRRLGALAFVRAKADMHVKDTLELPDAIVPAEDGATVQVWTPTRNPYCARMVRVAESFGVMVAMTSANIHGKPEITDLTAARSFARRHPDTMLVIEQEQLHDRPIINSKKITGSYPLVSIESDRIKLLRGGFLDPELLKDVLHDLPFEVATDEDYKQPAYPDNVLQRSDLVSSSQTLKGERLSRAILNQIIGSQPQ